MNTKDTITIAQVGSDTATQAVPANLFGQVVNEHNLTQYIQAYLVNQRQGHASTKDRSEVAGTTKKMYKQKGTGNARHGSAKAPIFKGGGVVGGPKPHEYELKMNKKQKTLALVSALSQLAASKNVSVLASDCVTVDSKTKDIAKIITDSFKSEKIVLVTTTSDKALVKIARNIKEVSIVGVQELNPYYVIYAKHLVFSADALKELVTRFS